jgi:hypothetical protein
MTVPAFIRTARAVTKTGFAVSKLVRFACMKHRFAVITAGLVLGAVLVACSGSSSAPVTTPLDDASTDLDASSAVEADAYVDKTAMCASTFGNAIGSTGFARFDGTVVAVLPPGNNCEDAGNRTHLVLEMTFSGAAYRMVVDVDDTSAPGTIHAHTMMHDMIGGPWQDGIHAVPLDYAGNFNLHTADFPSESTSDAVTAITNALDIGAHVSVFATAVGEVDSAHLIHRNLSGQDGAIVVGVDGPSPTWLLFAFADQSF